ncbi:MAG TPA: hypothetical protein VJ385_05525 [Fibrobacteria bacterium]|nr:hypothetical protein [Fibrobacteria bacterium]
MSVCLAAVSALFWSAPAGAAQRFFRPDSGFMAGKDLPADFRARVRSIRFDRRDAFEGTVAYTYYDTLLFRKGNDWHIKSRVSTLRGRLQFAEGDDITKDKLDENERALRSEEFLSDAIITVRPAAAGECDVAVTTFDQWTLALATGVQSMNVFLADFFLGRWSKLADDEWLWSVGLFESNLFGTGTKVGAAYRHTLERNARELVFSNGNLTQQHLQVAAYAALRTDGDSLSLSIAKPLLTRADKYAYALALTSTEASERLYFDANDLGALPSDLAGRRSDSANVARLFTRVAYREILASATRSYGSDLKVNVGPAFRFRDHYNLGGARNDSDLSAYVPLPASAAEPYQRTDASLGASFSLYRYAYRSMRNFHNLKWNESVKTGWRLNAEAAMNQEWLGAGDHDFRLSQDGTYTAFPLDDWYVNGSYSWQAFLSPGGEMADGRSDLLWETSWLEHPLTSTWLTGSWSGLFAVPASVQLTLGDLNGLNGYPSHYYAGQARLLATLEQRLHPEFELLTFVPAYSLYLTAGNTYPSWRETDARDLHYSVGLGLRLGYSKSTNKIVQHFNLNFPLGDKYLRGPLVTFTAKKTL